MPQALPLEVWLVIVAFFLLLCVAASKVSAKLGVPSLLFFLGIGMLAGSDGPGGVHFDNMEVTKALGSVALAFILFGGGLENNWQTLKPVAARAISLSTIGVAVTCALVGSFAHYALSLPWLPALLLGAIVSSTDAAAIFGVLRSSGIRLKHNITPLLEFESGTNDPVAIFLTLALTSLVQKPETPIASFVPMLLLEMPLGAAIGLVCGRFAVSLINRIRLEYDGLYPVITVATACLSFGGAHFIHGNPFLAVYIAGVVMGSRNFLHRLQLIQFHDALAWILQIVMFVVLGLLVFPSQLPAVVVPGILLSLFLIFVARPAAVFAALATAKMQKRTKFFIAWAGLRGAVPIILAIFPAIAGVPQAQTLFNLVFFIVLSSVLIQGTTLRAFARMLSVVAPNPSVQDRLKPAASEDLLEVEIAASSWSVGKQVVELGLPPTALIVLLKRAGQSYVPQGASVIEAGDRLLVATRRDDEADLIRRFEKG